MQLHFILVLLVSLFSIVNAVPLTSGNGLSAVDVMERDATPATDLSNIGWRRAVDMPRGGTKEKRVMESPKGTWKAKRDAAAQGNDQMGGLIVELQKRNAHSIGTGQSEISVKKLMKRKGQGPCYDHCHTEVPCID